MSVERKCITCGKEQPDDERWAITLLGGYPVCPDCSYYSEVRTVDLGE